jgi:hypothetical protein
LEVGANSLGGVLLLQGADEAGLNIFPALLVDLEGVQTVPPGLGSASEDAGQLLYFSLVPGGKVGGNHDSIDELASGGGVLAFVSVKQGQIGGPLETVMRCESIPEIGSLRLLLLIGYFEAASFSPFFSLYCFRLYVLQVQDSDPAAATNFVQFCFSMSN